MKGMLGAAAVLFLLAGCDQTVFELSLAPRGGLMHRELSVYTVRETTDEAGTVSRTNVDVPAERLAEFAAHYPQRAQDPARGVTVLSGAFGPDMPADLGAGQYVRYESPLGSGAVYLERLGGQLAQAQRVEAVLARADASMDLWVAWLGWELADEPGWRPLRAWLDTDVRRDLKDLALRSYVGADLWVSLGHPPAEHTLLAHAVQLAIERGYVRLPDAPALARAVGQQGLAGLLPYLQRLLAGRMGVEQGIPESLGFLASAERARQSWQGFLQAHPHAWRRVQATLWPAGAQIRDAEPAAAPQPPDELADMLAGLLTPGGDLAGFIDGLRVRLALPGEPIETNGQWDAQAGAVVWESSAPSEQAWPRVLYAVWAEPDDQAQRRLLGEVRLTGGQLLAYSVWYSSLTADEARRWDSELAALAGPADLWAHLGQFLEAEQADEWLQAGARLLRDALADSPATQPAGEGP